MDSRSATSDWTWKSTIAWIRLAPNAYPIEIACGLCHLMTSAAKVDAFRKNMVTKDFQLRQLSEATILDHLRTSGYRMTSSRNCIIRAIVGQGDAFTAQMLIDATQQKHDGIGRSTVFRTLDLLVTEGMLDQIHMADGSHRYTLAPNALVHHHHLICTSCEKILPFTGCTVDSMIDGLEQDTGFVISGHQLEFFGVCDDCQPELETPGTSVG